MTATRESSAAHPDCTAVVDEFAGRMKGLQLESLRAALQILQFRLGTKAEQPCDVERAQTLGHEINNRLSAGNTGTDLRQLRLPPVPPAP